MWRNLSSLIKDGGARGAGSGGEKVTSRSLSGPRMKSSTIRFENLPQD